MQDDPKNDSNQDVLPSKTQRKQAMRILQDIGKQLVEFDLGQLHQLDLPERLIDAILEAKQIRKHGARRRQIQYIGKLMRKTDTTSLQEKLASWRSRAQRRTA